DGVLLAEKEDILLEALFADQIFGRAAVWAVADEDQFCGHLGADYGEDFDYIGDALDRAEIGEVHQDGLVVGGPLSALRFIRCARVEVAVYEIGDYFDGALDVEFL